ncbi:NTP transferase domain-containing protein [Curvibacter sp. CHRR-16]|uniref:NTP transferase domain-containing protein n=1 Tax=Curvibacter sp. CHRR-16 TaxID=2835872 RepID=UPI001BDB100E|nr:NTP transferase domain-containing protein [Curvibacter sp. CHRR-16]MBT0570355.1 NTP transferase domain-containing protein [Curvibacter sp. CHRR-16]
MLLAAGRGERMRPLTDVHPKPLLAVHGKALLHWHLLALAQQRQGPVLVNTAWLGEQIAPHCAALDGIPPVRYSHEGQDFGRALETAGGIARALPQLAPVFWLAAGDVFVPDFVFDPAAYAAFAASDHLAHLWLVPNPTHNPAGDFVLHGGLALNKPTSPSDPHAQSPCYTYSTIALLRRELFAQPWCDIKPGNPAGESAALAPLLRKAMLQQRVSASLYTGRWTDVGTPERLAQLNATPL